MALDHHICRPFPIDSEFTSEGTKDNRTSAFLAFTYPDWRAVRDISQLPHVQCRLSTLFPCTLCVRLDKLKTTKYKCIFHFLLKQPFCGINLLGKEGRLGNIASSISATKPHTPKIFVDPSIISLNLLWWL